MVTDRLIRITPALAVLMVAGVAAIIGYQHAYKLVTSHGETGFTARLLPFTVGGLIWAVSMVALDASHRNHPVPRLALWSLAAGIVATVGANLAHGLGHGPVGGGVQGPSPSFRVKLILVGWFSGGSGVTWGNGVPVLASWEPKVYCPYMALVAGKKRGGSSGGHWFEPSWAHHDRLTRTHAP